VSTDPGMFEAFYASPLQHPGLLWLAVAAGLAFSLTRRTLSPKVRAYCAALAGLSALDAWLTSTDIPGIGALSGAGATLVPLFFVLAGDFRFLLVVTSGRPGGRLEINAKALGVAAAITAIVPLSSQVVVPLLPAALQGDRTLFLVYELLFASLTLGLLARHRTVRRVRWVRTVARYVLGYYVLWALADVTILWVGDLGFGLRVVPNLLYYGGLISVIGFAAARAGEDPLGGPPPS
jgi:hypothetical protein